MAETTYDIAIIGGGPAGYTSALYAGRAGYKAVVFEKASPGGQMGITSSIENYPGYEAVEGFELAMKMQAQAEKFGANIVYEAVTSLELDDKNKIVRTDSTEFAVKAVVLAMGAKPRLLGVQGEREYSGRGVSYCATCDGMFFRGKTVVVNGGGDTAFEDALYLSNICSKVILVHRRDSYRAAPSQVKKAEARENIEFIKNANISEVIGDGKFVTAVKLTDVNTGAETTVDCSGIFVAVGRIPETSLVQGKLDLDNSGYVVADESTKTSVEGVFAAGDVRTKALRQIVTACADGAMAIHFAEEILDRM